MDPYSLEVLMKGPTHEFRKGASDILQLPLQIAGSIAGFAVGLVLVIIASKFLLFVMGW